MTVNDWLPLGEPRQHRIATFSMVRKHVQPWNIEGAKAEIPQHDPVL